MWSSAFPNLRVFKEGHLVRSATRATDAIRPANLFEELESVLWDRRNTRLLPTGFQARSCDQSTPMKRSVKYINTLPSRRGKRIGAQASCLWGYRARRLVVTFRSAGKMPAGPTAKMAVLRQLRSPVFLCFLTGFRLCRAAAAGFLAVDIRTSSSRLNVRRRLVPTSRNSISYQPFIRST